MGFDLGYPLRDMGYPLRDMGFDLGELCELVESTHTCRGHWSLSWSPISWHSDALRVFRARQPRGDAFSRPSQLLLVWTSRPRCRSNGENCRPPGIFEIFWGWNLSHFDVSHFFDVSHLDPSLVRRIWGPSILRYLSDFPWGASPGWWSYEIPDEHEPVLRFTCGNTNLCYHLKKLTCGNTNLVTQVNFCSPVLPKKVLHFPL
jgi:hypothetical protein